MHIRIFLLYLLSLLLTSAIAEAQDAKTITGVVRGTGGSPLSGATVNEKGTSNSAVTNNSGAFTIRVAPNATLVISYTGYTSREVSAEGDGPLSINLEAGENALTEVVVTGFGVRRQTRKLSYATQEIKAEEIQRAPSPNVLNSLQGKLSGVRIDQGTGGPGSSSRIRIRGNTSLSGNQQPIIVIDGVIIKPEVTGPETWSDNNNRDPGNIMKNINQDDIENISVLKGSAASALYGSGAQNGVILITTKRGRVQRGLGVSFNMTQMFDKVYAGPELQSEYGAGIDPQFTTGADGTPEVSRSSSGVNNVWTYSYGPRFEGQRVRDLDGRMITWQPYDILSFFQTGRQSNYNVAVEGGTERNSIRLSYSKNISEGIIPNGNELNRDNFAFRGTQRLAKFINVDAGVTYSRTKNDNPLRQVSNFNPLFRMTFYRPRSLDWDYYINNYVDKTNGGRIRGTADPYSVGAFLWTTFNENTYARENNLRANLDITTNITPWLTLMTRGNFNDFSSVTELKYLGSDVGFAGGNYEYRTREWRNNRLQGLLTANRELTSKLEASVTIGAESNREQGGIEARSFTDGGLQFPGVFSLSNARNGVRGSQSFIATKRTDAIYAYGDITFNRFLTGNFSVRKDYNSTLTYRDTTGNWTFVYPSAGLALIFSDLLKNNTAYNFLSFGKLRASYGETGRDVDAWRFNQIGLYQVQGARDVITRSSSGALGAGQLTVGSFSDNTIATKGLKNERTKEWEFGTDLRFFNNRLGLDVTYYIKNTFNQIINLPIPLESGGTSALFNVGQIRNKGLEILANATPIQKKDFRWNFNVNFSRNRNTVVELAPGVASYDLITAFGADVRAVAQPGREYGQVLTQYAFAYYQKRDASGKPIDHPSNGQKVIGTPQLGSRGYTFLRSGQYREGLEQDVALGSIMEKFTGGTYQTFRYKDFSLNVQVDAKIGGLLASGTHQFGGSNGTFAFTLPGRDAAHGGLEYTTAQGVKRNDGIIPDGVFADGIKVTVGGQTIDLGGMSWSEAVTKGYMTPKPAWQYYEDLTQWSSGIREYSIFENSWVALREVSLEYNVPGSLTNRLKLNNLRVNLIGRNLRYLYRTAKDGINPEGLSSNQAAAFAEYGGIPFVRSLGLSVFADF